MAALNALRGSPPQELCILAPACARSPAGLSGSLDGDDALDLLEGLHHALQLLQVLADEREEIHGSPVVAGAAVRLADVDALGHEALADVGEDARQVGRHDAELHAPVDPRLAVPRDLDAPLRIRVERLLTASPVDGHAAPARDEAEDVVAREGIATLGVTNEDVVDPVDADRPLVALHHLAHEPRQAPFAHRLRRPALAALLARRRDELRDLLGIDLAVADADE